MPTVFRKDGYRFFFYSNEGDPIEPIHIHVQKAGAEAKFWMSAEVSVARSNGFDAKALRKLMNFIESNRIEALLRIDGMSISAKNVKFDSDSMWVDLSDGRTIGVPLAWFPRLLNAPLDSLEKYSLSPYGIHWETLDEDISVGGLLAGRGDQTKQGKEAA